MKLRVKIILAGILAVCCSCDILDQIFPGNNESGDETEVIEDNENDGNSETTEGGGDSDDPTGTGKDEDADTSGSDDSFDESEFTKVLSIVWNGDNVEVNNGTKLAVSNEGGHVTVGAPESEGQKVRINLSGSTENGSLKIYNGVKANDTNKKMLLSFEGVSLKSQVGPAINIQSGKSVYVLLKDGSENSLSDAAVYGGIPEGEDAKGCFFSEKQLLFYGNGKLTVEGKSKHAICVDDYLHITSGEIVISASKSDGIHTKDYVQIDGGSLKIDSDGESIQCEDLELGYFYMTAGEVELNPKGEKCGGIETERDIIIDGGKLSVNAGGAAAKCLKSNNNVTINNGAVILKTTGAGVYDATERDTSAAACIRAENNIVFNGGNISCTSTGNGGKGLNCYRFFCHDGATVTVKTAGGVYSYSSYKSRPKAIKATKNITIEGGDLDIQTTGTEGEGLESKDSVFVNGGKIVIVTKDDGINAAGVITFNGGYSFVQSTGNDGIDTNRGKAGSIVVNGGVVIAHSTTSPEEAFDADNHAYLTFNGGYMFSTGGLQGGGGGGGFGGRPGGGGSGTSGSSPSCGQPTMLWNSSATKGYFTLTDNSGTLIMSCYVPRAMSSCYTMFSAPLKAGSSYKCGFTAAAPSGATEVFGTYFYNDGTASGTLSKTFTAPSGYGTL